MNRLSLNLKAVYFQQILSGEKKFEFRELNDYWTKRLVNRSYDELLIQLGYPSAQDNEKRILLPYLGYEIQTIRHPHFGNLIIQVYAIRLDISQRKSPIG